MQSHKKLKKLIKLALVATTLTASNIVPIVTDLISSAQAVAVTGKRANSLNDSIRVNTHLMLSTNLIVKLVELRPSSSGMQLSKFLLIS